MTLFVRIPLRLFINALAPAILVVLGVVVSSLFHLWLEGGEISPTTKIETHSLEEYSSGRGSGAGLVL